MVKTETVLTLAAIGIGGYLLYKFVKPLGDVASTAGQGAAFVTSTNPLGSPINPIFPIVNAPQMWDKVKELYADIQKSFQNSGVNQVFDSNAIKQTTTSDYVVNVTNTGSAYGIPTVQVRTRSGRSSSVIAAPNTYYPNLGIGFNSSGQGYSAAAPLPTPNTSSSSNSSTNSVVKAVQNMFSTNPFTGK